MITCLKPKDCVKDTLTDRKKKVVDQQNTKEKQDVHVVVVLLSLWSISQFHNHAQQVEVTNSGGPISNQTYIQTTARNKNFHFFPAQLHFGQRFSILSCKLDYPVARPNLSFLITYRA